MVIQIHQDVYGNTVACSKSSTKFSIPDTKLYVPVLIVSTQDNTKLLKQKASCFKRIISWNKYLK